MGQDESQFSGKTETVKDDPIPNHPGPNQLKAGDPGEQFREVPAQLRVTQGYDEAWLIPATSPNNVDLHLKGKGGGKVYIHNGVDANGNPLGTGTGSPAPGSTSGPGVAGTVNAINGGTP